MRKRTNFKEEVERLVGDEYTLLGEYVNNKLKLDIRHNVCGHQYAVQPIHFLRGSRCPNCNGRLKERLTHKEVEKRIFEAGGQEYTLLSKYKNSRTKIHLRHETCGTTFQKLLHHFLKGYHCPVCRKANKQSIA